MQGQGQRRMDARSFISRGFLKLDDVRAHPYVGVVVAVTEVCPRHRWRPTDQATPKLALEFPDGRSVIVEGRNLATAIHAWGEETDGWIGRRVMVRLEAVPTGSGRIRERKVIEPAEEGA